MSARPQVTIDGNQAAAHVAHRLSEVIAIYPITPSSNMGEWSDEWAATGVPNLWGTVPLVQEMQSEGGASAAVHGATQTGALTTTFTASQGLLLMIPTMFKMGGELTPTVFHVSARTVATHALSIFGDHSDIMAVRACGYGLLCSGSVQEIMDLATITHAASLESRIPFIHYFDGFRNSHEVMKIEQLNNEDLAAVIDMEHVAAHRSRALTPDNPVIRGTAQNPDVFFQARETVNPFYDACPDIVQKTMDRFAQVVGRQYHLFDYVGDPSAERVIVMMGSGAEAAHETVEYLQGQGEKVGVVKVRLFRPFVGEKLIAALPQSVKSIAVLDRTKEPGAEGEPLYKDVISALMQAAQDDRLPMAMPKVVGGRYGLSSKEFTPKDVKAVYDNLKADKPRNQFTIGIVDDVTNTSLNVEQDFSTEPDDVVRCMFYGLGSDGTVGANKNSIKIIGEETPNHAQGYFVYDSKKAGSVTVSHLRFGPRPIRSSYLITSANFVACHNWSFLEKYDMLKNAVDGATFLLNSPFSKDETWSRMPRKVQQQIIDKQLNVYAIDGYKVAKETGMGGRINTIMQTCFFAISGILPREEAIEKIKDAIKKTYGKKGEEIVKRNCAAVDATLDNMYQITIPAAADSTIEMPPTVAAEAPEFVKDVLAEIYRRPRRRSAGQRLPEVMARSRLTPRCWEKRNIAMEIPIWDRADLHPVRQVCPRVPPCRHPDEALSRELPEGRAGGLQVTQGDRQGARGAGGHDPDRPRRLHGLWDLRRGVPGQEQAGGAAQGDQHGVPAADPRA
jgi:pyruvate-ferredoxin/flavodoxin oxidoreductase